jgi:hypothetical protein
MRAVEAAQGSTGWLQQTIGAIGEVLIRLFIRIFGRSVVKSDAPWLQGPIGPAGKIGEAAYEHVAEREGLRIERADDAGLIPDFSVLESPDFDPTKVIPEVRHFYEHTSLYRMEVWSDAAILTRVFLWLLVTTVSRRMDQLNFPVSPLDVSRGMTSEVLPVRRLATGEIVYTGWLRKFAGTGRVIYAGFYTTERPPSCSGRCVKVVFPLPRGSATVLLRPGVDPDGSFRLISSGTRFGGPGFYRMLETDEARWKVRYLRTLREFFHVYLDEERTLRTDHLVKFLGLTVLRLHYKLTQASPEPASTAK